jgi:hypothetical protein
MTVDPKEVSQRVAETLNSEQKEKEGDKAEQAEADVENRVRELEAQKKEIEARKKEIALKLEMKRRQEVEAKKLAKLEKELAEVEAEEKEIEEAKHIRGWYQPKALGVGVGLGLGFDVSVRYTRNISPNFGVDIFNLSGGLYVKEVWYGQLLTGRRFATNRFGRSKYIYFYTSVRAGVGYINGSYYYNNSGFAFAAELEAGIHFKRFFLGAAVNQGFFELGEYHSTFPFIGLRLGWDIGKRKSY